MVKNLIEFLKNTKFSIFLLFIILILPSVIFSYFFLIEINFFIKIFLVFLFFILTVLLIEINFNIFYKLYNGNSYVKIPKIEFSKITVKPHPYLPFIYKSNFYNQGVEKINFPINKYEYYAPKLKTNSLGFYNGVNGDREIDRNKKNIRINCIGASTTGNYLQYQNNIYSYPLELEKILNQNKKTISFEVNNCAQGGYNSADLLVRFSLQILDTKPDLIIIYHAYNDIRSYLVDDFKSDYSNSKRNLGEVMWKYYLSSMFPSSKLNFLNYLFNNWFPNNDRYSLIESISFEQKFELEDYELGLNTFERNIQSIINLCKANNIKVILSTFCFFLHKDIQNNFKHLKLKKILEKENYILKKLSLKNNLALVDNENLIEKNIDNFVDSIHFSHIGMKKIAENFAKEINKTIK